MKFMNFNGLIHVFKNIQNICVPLKSCLYYVEVTNHIRPSSRVHCIVPR